jgi:4-carboxymuconolactone decarboxylase
MVPASFVPDEWTESPNPCQHRLFVIGFERVQTMDKQVYERGLAKRRAVLGDAYVDRALAGVDDFNRDFQRLVTQYCWGEAWGDETLTPRERSILNLGMIACLGKMHEFESHFRGALTNGLTPDELRAVLTQITVYCGVPVGVDCFRAGQKILAEAKKP